MTINHDEMTPESDRGTVTIPVPFENQLLLLIASGNQYCQVKIDRFFFEAPPEEIGRLIENLLTQLDVALEERIANANNSG
jgi:hypothetical protein